MGFAVGEHTIFLTLSGSHAHGTSRAESDVDVRGVCIAPLRSRLSLFESFEQHEGALPHDLEPLVRQRLERHPRVSPSSLSEIECAIFDVAKFISLCAGCNPNALEILFADERDWILETPRWRKLHAQRHKFLTRKVEQTFLGYAMAQLKRIKTHRAWLLSPPKKKPSREDFGLPAATGTIGREDQDRLERAIAEKIRSYGIDDLELPKPTRLMLRDRIEAFYRDALRASEDDLDTRMRAVAGLASGVSPEVMATLEAERRYRAALRHWEAYETWKSQRNPARAELERKHGYDTKHAMHLIRLLRMGLEILEHGDLRVRRDDADELIALRAGSLPYDELLALAEDLKAAMDRASRRADLPQDIDRGDVDRIAFELISH